MKFDKRLVLDMRQSSDNALLLDGSGDTIYSKAIALDQLEGDVGDVVGHPTEIGFNIHNVTATLTGNWQGVIATADADVLEGSTKWQNIDGGSLAQWGTGGCSVIKAPYTHIRLKVDSGKCSVALASSTRIRQISS